MRAELAGLAIADPPELWRALGFAVSDGDRVATVGASAGLSTRLAFMDPE